MFAINKSMARLLAGFLLAPLGPGLLLMFLAIFTHPGEGVWGLGLFALFYYPAMLVLGLPAHFLLVKIHWVNGWGYVLAGMVVGVIAAMAVFGGVALHNLSLAIIAALLGALTAWTFWLIARPSGDK